MPVARLKEFLDRNDVPYETIPHAPAYTTEAVAAAAQIPPRQVAKTVMVKIDGEMAMVVLEAPDKVDVERLREVTGAETVGLAEEEEFTDLFPNCEPGAMPPFGNLWGMRVFVDQRLREDEVIAFNAGTHDELVRLAYGAFERLVEPVVAELSGQRG
jgi:Ala-tRNA(Pro) deacylase